MKKNIKIKKKYSLIEIVISIMIVPLLIGIISSLFIHNYKITNALKYNVDNYSNIYQLINQLNIDASSSYDILIQDNKITLFNSKGIIEYSFQEEKKAFYRNNKYYAYLTGISIHNTTTTANLHPIYELTFYSDIHNINNVSTPFELTTKLSIPIKID